MADSLLIRKILELRNLQDSNANHMYEIQKSIDSIAHESWFFKMLPLLGVIVGGAITWLAQNSLKKSELKNNNQKELKVNSNKILTSLISLQFQLKELAYLEVDTNYQLYLYYTSENTEKLRAYEEMYNNYKFKADVKNKISLYVSDIYSGFTTYYRLSNIEIPNDLSTLLEEFTNHIMNLPPDPEWQEGQEFSSETFTERQTILVAEYFNHISRLLGFSKLLI
jgi:hypothetical protein